MADLRLEIDDQLTIVGWTIGNHHAIANHHLIINLQSEI